MTGRLWTLACAGGVVGPCRMAEGETGWNAIPCASNQRANEYWATVSLEGMECPMCFLRAETGWLPRQDGSSQLRTKFGSKRTSYSPIMARTQPRDYDADKGMLSRVDLLMTDTILYNHPFPRQI